MVLVIDLFTPAEKAAMKRAEKLADTIGFAKVGALCTTMSLVAIMALFSFFLLFQGSKFQKEFVAIHGFATEFLGVIGVCLAAVFIAWSPVYLLFFRSHKVRKEAELRELLRGTTARSALPKLWSMEEAFRVLLDNPGFDSELCEGALSERLEKYAQDPAGGHTSLAMGT